MVVEKIELENLIKEVNELTKKEASERSLDDSQKSTLNELKKDKKLAGLIVSKIIDVFDEFNETDKDILKDLLVDLQFYSSRGIRQAMKEAVEKNVLETELTVFLSDYLNKEYLPFAAALDRVKTFLVDHKITNAKFLTFQEKWQSTSQEVEKMMREL